MAKAISSVASSYSDYVDKSAKLFTERKFGEFAKYLEETPIFLKAYYSLSDISTRAEQGTGNVNEEIGKQSPSRYNKIKNLPVCNLRDLKPNVEYDTETGYDINVENNDLTFLPNTIKPKPGDYFIVELPNTKPLLFRINGANFNSIQSNDFYLADYELREIGEQALIKEALIEKQVIDTYVCIYENIGSEDKAIILDTDFEKVKELSKFYTQLKEVFMSLYFHREIDAFAYKGPYSYKERKQDKGNPNKKYTNKLSYGFRFCKLHRDSFFEGCPVAECEECPHFYACNQEELPEPLDKKCQDPLCPIHGPFVSKLKEAQDLLNQNRPQLPPEFNTIEIPECYFYDMYLIKFLQNTMLFEENHSDETFSLIIDDIVPINFDYLYRRSFWYALENKDLDFLDRYMISIPKRNKKINSMFNLYRLYTQSTSLEQVDKNLYNADKDIEEVGFKHYLPKLLINAVVDKKEEEIEKLSYCERLIYDYFNNSLPKELECKSILIELLEPSELNLKYGVMILFILKKIYDSYFEKKVSDTKF